MLCNVGKGERARLTAHFLLLGISSFAAGVGPLSIYTPLGPITALSYQQWHQHINRTRGAFFAPDCRGRRYGTYPDMSARRCYQFCYGSSTSAKYKAPDYTPEGYRSCCTGTACYQPATSLKAPLGECAACTTINDWKDKQAAPSPPPPGPPFPPLPAYLCDDRGNLVKNGDFEGLKGWNYDRGTYTFERYGEAWLGWGETLRSAGSLSQTLHPRPGAGYMLTYRLLNPGGIPAHWQTKVGNQTFEASDNGPATDYVSKKFLFIAPLDSELLSLTFVFRHDAAYFHLANVSVTPLETCEQQLLPPLPPPPPMPPARCAAGGNSIRNGNFTQGLMHWQYQRGPYTYAGNSYAWLGWGSDDVSDGSLSQTVQVQPNTEYVLSYSLTSDGTAPNFWKVNVGDRTLEETLDHATPFEASQRRFIIQTGPAEDSLNITFSYRQDIGYWYLTDVQLTPLVPCETSLLWPPPSPTEPCTGATQNLVTNGDFAREFESWDFEVGTYTYVKKGVAWLAWGSVLREVAGLSQRFRVQGSTTYRLTYSLKGGGGIPNDWRVEVDGKAVEEYADMYPPMDWEERNFLFTTSPGASDAVLSFWYRQDNSYWYLKNVSVSPAYACP